MSKGLTLEHHREVEVNFDFSNSEQSQSVTLTYVITNMLQGFYVIYGVMLYSESNGKK